MAVYRQETATTICIRIQGLRFNILQFCFNQILGNLFHYKEHHVVMLEWKSQVTEERLQYCCSDRGISQHKMNYCLTQIMHVNY